MAAPHVRRREGSQVGEHEGRLMDRFDERDIPFSRVRLRPAPPRTPPTTPRGPKTWGSTTGSGPCPGCSRRKDRWPSRPFSRPPRELLPDGILARLRRRPRFGGSRGPRSPEDDRVPEIPGPLLRGPGGRRRRAPPLSRLLPRRPGLPALWRADPLRAGLRDRLHGRDGPIHGPIGPERPHGPGVRPAVCRGGPYRRPAGRGHPGHGPSGPGPHRRPLSRHRAARRPRRGARGDRPDGPADDAAPGAAGQAGCGHHPLRARPRRAHTRHDGRRFLLPLPEVRGQLPGPGHPRRGAYRDRRRPPLARRRRRLLPLLGHGRDRLRPMHGRLPLFARRRPFLHNAVRWGVRRSALFRRDRRPPRRCLLRPPAGPRPAPPGRGGLPLDPSDRPGMTAGSRKKGRWLGMTEGPPAGLSGLSIGGGVRL
ncbi:MAG: hypothetical protein MZU79_04455 [Anaerotruncus sp.]|nr:hypothetical protein [Anaerotruncus sp.]